MFAVEVENVSFAYGGVKVLDGVSLRLRKNQVTAIMGNSGCGKTTLLRLMLGISEPQSGHIWRERWDPTLGHDQALKEWRTGIGVLFQNGALFTDMDVFENVAFPLRRLTSLPESVIADIVKLKLHVVGLRGAAGLMPSNLSGGMAKRVALARSIALDPALMVYDEPFSGLDPISLDVIAHLIRQLNDALGAASVLVSHDLEETFAIADYVYLLANGRVIAEGTPVELMSSKEPFVDQFVRKKSDGPVPFHYPQQQHYFEDLGFSTSSFFPRS